MEKQGFDLAMHYFRAFAIFSVISVHMWIVPPLEGHESMSRFLDMLRGVLFHSSTLYFVFISGYLFHFLAQRKFDLRTYYRKKLLNVIVPYVILSVFFTGYAFFWYSYTGEVPRFTKLATGCREFFQALLYGDVVLTYWYIPFIATIFLVALLLRLSEERFALLTLFTVWIPCSSPDGIDKFLPQLRFLLSRIPARHVLLHEPGPDPRVHRQHIKILAAFSLVSPHSSASMPMRKSCRTSRPPITCRK
ncbi:MAG: acyltransferase family protein [Bilophila wadsworthia]